MPAGQETWVRSLGQEDPLEKGVATYSSSCLGNSMGSGAWRATVPGVAKSWTRLSHLAHKVKVKSSTMPEVMPDGRMAGCCQLWIHAGP